MKPDFPAPRAIRDALIPEEVPDFDWEWVDAMRQATESLDLAPVDAMLDCWRRIAILSMDPERHRQMLETVRKLEAGIDVPMTPWPELKERLGL